MHEYTDKRLYVEHTKKGQEGLFFLTADRLCSIYRIIIFTLKIHLTRKFNSLTYEQKMLLFYNFGFVFILNIEYRAQHC